MYRNCEGYASPTEGKALAHIIHEERVAARAERRKKQKFRKVWVNPNPYRSRSVPKRKEHKSRE